MEAFARVSLVRESGEGLMLLQECAQYSSCTMTGFAYALKKTDIANLYMVCIKKLT